MVGRLRVVVSFLLLAAFAGPGVIWSAPPAAALSPDVVISQVYGGGGNSGAPYNHDFVELVNRGTSTVSLSGLSLQYTSATGTGLFSSVTVLGGSVAPGQYYLVQMASSNTAVGAPLPTPDAIGSAAMSATGGKIVLVTSTSALGCNGSSTPCSPGQLALIKDLVGWGTANFSETSPAPATSNTTAVFRKTNGCTETDDNSADFAAAAPAPRNTASPFDPCTAPDAAPAVTATYPANGAADFPIDADLTVTFSEPVNVTAPWFTLVCSVSGTVAASFSGGPTTFTIDPAITLAHGETCTLTVLAAAVADQDGNDPPDNMVTDFTVGFSPFDVCSAPYTPVPAIQGSGPAAAITGTVTTQGVVVGDFEGTAAASGFYLQDPAGDGDPATSDGIFVFTGSGDLVSEGQVVRVTGFARERFNQTTINGANSNTAAVPAANVVQCGTGSVPATDVALPFADAAVPERYEGMYVRLPQPLVISEYFNYDRFGEIVLALPLPGETRPFTGTAIDEPGAAANARTLANSLSRITLDDATSAQNPAVLRHPNGLPFSLVNRFRGGDTVQNAIGVLGFDFSLYRIFPTAPADYTAVNLRPAAPEPVGGTLKVAAMNTLNFFVTPDYPTGDPLDNACGPSQNVECRGWDFNQPDEFNRQRAKLLDALAGLDADVIGLNELENTAGVEPMADIVAGLPGYAYVDTGTIGTDAIKVGLIYRTANVTPVGSYAILDSSVDPRFLDSKNRPSLAQTFQDVATGGRFTVVVNHFKSKGSACVDVGDPDLGDGQGNCSGTRTLAAQALVDWLATDPTGSGDPDVIIVGDLNSYAMEDAIDAVQAGADDVPGTSDDYTNLIAHFQGTYAYSYVFDGQFGYLDHALASASLMSQVTGAADWHINADEPDVFDYDTSFKPPSQDALYEPNAFRSSDHDPVVVGLNAANYPPVAGTVTVTPGLVLAGTPVSGSVPFTDPDALDAHTAVWNWGDGTTSAGTVVESGGSGTVTGSHVYAAPGVYDVTVTIDDGYGNTAAAVFSSVVVYDPAAGSVTGGGWFTSPAGASTAFPAATGKANLGFTAKYKKGATVPEGNTQFVFQAGATVFHSTGYEWLVVDQAAKTARLKGSGTVNGVAGYHVMVWAFDGSPDTFRIRIWTEDAGGTHVVYDNGTTPLGGGNVVIHA